MRVDAWWHRLDDVEDESCVRLTGSLSRNERQHAERFHRALDRRRYCIRRGILRELLAHYLACAPREVPIAHTEFGKPYVEGTDVTFNLSHSRGMALYAFARGRAIGCDVEWRISRFATQRTAELVLSQAEMAAWRALPERQLANAFFDYWTCKEAYVKALGVGLAVPPQEITVSLIGQPRLIALPQDNAADWSLVPIDLHTGYSAVVATRGPAPVVHLREFEPAECAASQSKTKTPSDMTIKSDDGRHPPFSSRLSHTTVFRPSPGVRVVFRSSVATRAMASAHYATEDAHREGYPKSAAEDELDGHDANDHADRLLQGRFGRKTHFRSSPAFDQSTM
jgi:4'-phosphopantetheinyl transferase